MKPAPTALTALSAALLAACTTTTPAGGDAIREVAFDCTNGETLSVRFDQARERATLVRHGNEIELPQQVSGSGFIYSNGPNTIRGKGDALTVEIGRMVPIECTARPGRN
ncbi:MliC family protein [Lysobacter sp. GX 14042]|uniref:MliC family protein n=1 Tax=Lysobacter sp. GX 14042 TaxID=2907155 RepID=UPI001F1CE4DA|nr:MliC family protein [Lysobacter sp. GX 14042]MCE7032926.1 MliC family protein [Lysobacter sp. GX 14042]